MLSTVEELAEELIEAGTIYLAVSEESLANQQFELLYHRPNPPEELAESLNAIDEVHIDGKTLSPVMFASVIHSDIHLQGRVPIYAEDNARLGLDRISLDEGLSNVREFLSGETTPTSVPSETVSAETVLDELVDAGAAAIALEREIFEVTGGDLLEFRVHMPPATGAEMVNSYDRIVVDGETYDVRFQFTLGGPNFMTRVPVYADSIIGLDDVGLEEGLANLHGFLAESERAHTA